MSTARGCCISARIGPGRELKKALEAHWSGQSPEKELLDEARGLRKRAWKLQASLGIALPPSNDFSLYDQVLDTVALVGAVPERYRWSGDAVDLDTYFAMARGAQTDEPEQRHRQVREPHEREIDCQRANGARGVGGRREARRERRA